MHDVRVASRVQLTHCINEVLPVMKKGEHRCITCHWWEAGSVRATHVRYISMAAGGSLHLTSFPEYLLVA